MKSFRWLLGVLALTPILLPPSVRHPELLGGYFPSEWGGAASIAVLALGTVPFAIAWKEGRRHPPTYAILSVLATLVFLTCVARLSGGPDSPSIVTENVVFLGLGILAGSAMGRLDQAWRAFAVLGTIQATYALVTWLTGDSVLMNGRLPRAAGTAASVDVTYVILTLLCVALASPGLRLSRTETGLSRAFLVVAAGALAVTASRLGFFAFGLTLLVSHWSRLAGRVRLGIGAGLAAALIGIEFTRTVVAQGPPQAGRWALWMEAIPAAIRVAPWGAGLGQFDIPEPGQPGYGTHDPKSPLLLLFGELGIPGLVIGVAVLGSLWFMGRSRPVGFLSAVGIALFILVWADTPFLSPNRSAGTGLLAFFLTLYARFATARDESPIPATAPGFA